MAVRATDCELSLRGAWQVIDISQALKLSPPGTMRCIECGGRVRAHKASAEGMQAHFEHFDRHAGCSRSDAFNGTHSPHPRPARL